MTEYDTITLRDLVVKHYAVNELRLLVQSFDLEYENLLGDTKEAKAGELVGHLDRRGQIRQLVDRLRKERPNVARDFALKKVPLPVVIITLIQNEVEHLLESDDKSLQRIFQLIESSNDQCLARRYHEQNRDGWHPFGDSQGTIQEVLDTFGEAGISVSGRSFQVEFEFHSEDFFSGDEVEDWILERMAVDGCLFIVDGLALFHVDIVERFRQAILGGTPRAVFFLSPTNLRELELSRLLEERIRQFYRLFFVEHDTQLSPHRGFMISNGTELYRSLRNCLKELDLIKRAPTSWKEQYRRAGIVAYGMGQEMQSIEQTSVGEQ